MTSEVPEFQIPTSFEIPKDFVFPETLTAKAPKIRKQRKVREIPAGAAKIKPTRKLSEKQLTNLKKWRDACYEILGSKRVIKKDNPKYNEAKELYAKKMAQ